MMKKKKWLNSKIIFTITMVFVVCGSMATSLWAETVGNTTVFGSTSTSNNHRAMPFTMPENGIIESVTMYHNGGGGGNMVLCVYDGESLPQNLLAITTTTSVSTTPGWQTIDLISSVYVPGATTIWLGWFYTNNPGTRYQTGTPGRAERDPFGNWTIKSYIYSIYATYTPFEPTYKTVGNTTVFGSTSYSNNLRAMPFTMPEDGKIISVTMYHHAGSGWMCFGVYEGEGSPQNLLAQTLIKVVSGSTGWQTIDLINPVYVTGGATIWLAWCYESNPGIRYQTGTPGRADADVECVCPLPDPFGTSTQKNYIYSIYATYTPD
jgi:hypothetical protein